MKRSILACLVVLAVWLGLATLALAHEMRPAYLQVDQSGDGSARVVWKQPAQGDVAIRLQPKLSNGWLDGEPSEQYWAGGFIVTTWVVHQSASLAGVRLEVDGLKDTLTEVLVRFRRPGVGEFTAVLRPSDPTLVLPEPGEVSRFGFLALGVEHILSGPDHLLFVFGLLLLVPRLRLLATTLTAFTVAHSITLAAASLGHLRVPVPLVETLVSLSIVFLAIEIVGARQGQNGVTLRRPWIIAFAFGLLHGCAFASGLTPLEPDRAGQAIALLLFNLGVETGQLLFVAVMLLASHALRRSRIRWPWPTHATPVYAVGGLGVFWTLQNAGALFAL